MLGDLSDGDISAILHYVLNKPSGNDPKRTLKKYIRYNRTKKAVLFVRRFGRLGMKYWGIYRLAVSLRKIRSFLKTIGLETTNFTNLVRGHFGIELKYSYYVTSDLSKKGDILEGLIICADDEKYLLACPELSEIIDKKMETIECGVVRYVIPPYLLKKLLGETKDTVISIVYSLNPQITGVRGVEELEIRGPDVMRGLPYLIARLDKFKGIISLFGPPVRITFANGIMIDRKGVFCANNIWGIEKLFRMLKKIR